MARHERAVRPAHGGLTIASRDSFVVALALAIAVHAALLYRSRALAHGDRMIAAPASMMVRVIAAPPVAPSRAGDGSAVAAPTPAATAVDNRESPPRRVESARVDTGTTVAQAAAREDGALVSSAANTSKSAKSANELEAPERSVSDSPATLPPASQGLPAAPEYLPAAKLNPGPFPLEDINPEYPEAAQDRSGSVVMRLLIDETGRVADIAVVRSAPPGLFEQSALTAFGRAKFSPGKLLGMPVKSQITVEVEFTPLNRGARVSGRGY